MISSTYWGSPSKKNPMNWDTQVECLLSKASSRLYTLRVCRYYKYSISSLDLLFQSLILSIFIYGIEVWGNAFYSKYLRRTDKFFARAFESGYCIERYCITDILKRRDFKLWRRITTTESAPRDLLPPKRTR